MGAAVMSASEFEDLIDRVERKTEELVRKSDELIARLRHWASWLGPLGHSIGEVLAQIPPRIHDFVAWLVDLFANPGVPWTLWNHGNDWSGPPVAGKLSNLVGKATLDETRVDDAWQGPAADAYKNTLPRQKEALGKLVTFAQQIDDALTKMGIAIGALWLAILTAITAFVIEVIVESGAAATGVGAPAAAGGLAASVAKVLAIVSGALDLFFAFVVANTLPVLKQLHQNLNDNSSFPDGNWPRSTTDLSDGSLSDGDTTDWRVRA